MTSRRHTPHTSKHFIFYQIPRYVCLTLVISLSFDQCLCRKIPNFGMVSVSFTIGMVPSTTPKRRSHRFFVCVKVCLVQFFIGQIILHKNGQELDFDKENEILFRLGIIYKQQGKFEDSLTCFDRILRNPPSPLAHADIWFQIGHVFEQQKDVSGIYFYFAPYIYITFANQHLRAKDAYERVVEANPGHAKVLQQLGWLYHQDGSSFQNQDLAIQYLTKSLEAGTSLIAYLSSFHS